MDFPRRSFLVGAGALITASFVRTAGVVARNTGAPFLLSEVSAPQVLYASPTFNEFPERFFLTIGKPQDEPSYLPTWGEFFVARLVVRGGRTLVVGSTPSSARRDPILIKALRSAHKMVPRDASGMPRIEASPPTPYLRRVAKLAFLAPDIQAAILAGTQPPALQLEQLMHQPIPLLWADQAAFVGR